MIRSPEKSDLLEADLSQFHHLDMRDLWRRDEQGHRRLTLRMVFVRIRHGLPATSALAIDSNGGKWPWQLSDHLLADVFFELQIARLGKKARDHPGRPKQGSNTVMTAERAARVRAARRRAERRRASSNESRRG